MKIAAVFTEINNNLAPLTISLICTESLERFSTLKELRHGAASAPPRMSETVPFNSAMDLFYPSMDLLYSSMIFGYPLMIFGNPSMNSKRHQ